MKQNGARGRVIQDISCELDNRTCQDQDPFLRQNVSVKIL